MTLAPMLAQPATVADVARIGPSATWVLEQKIDGDRKIVILDGGEISVLNRRGDPAPPLPGPVMADLKRIASRKARVVLDGELVDKHLHLFDLVCFNETVAPADPWWFRRQTLEQLVERWQPTAVSLLPVARTKTQKRKLIKQVTAGGLEGIVAKDARSLYRYGPKRGREWLKIKQTRTVDCFVVGIGTTKENMQVAVYQDGKQVEIGECSRLEGDGPKVAAAVALTNLFVLMGSLRSSVVIEVAFLNAGRPDAPRLYQPHAKRLRTDKTADECEFSQLAGAWIDKQVLTG